MLLNYKYKEEELKTLLKSLTVVIDRREKENKHITEWFDKKKIPYVNKSLSTLDYSFYLPANPELGISRDIWFDKDIAIERKASLTELSGNFAQNRDRFEKEMSTAKSLYKYLLIENSNYEDIVNGKYNTMYNTKSFLGTLHSFNHKYDLQIMFMPDKAYSAMWMYGTFQYYLRDILR